ncbi:MAG TPA: hypothetical protein VJ692_09760 [Nitrospiraceae bacterium]|nr:hypothetical protein [Nitrospiraceae bacterium]
MPLIWCAISAHGFGHAAQIIPVLNEVHRRVAGLTVILRTQVPARFFEGRLHPPWELSRAEQDIGCVQHGPLHIDVRTTWTEYRRFHGSWQARVQQEAQIMESRNPDLVLSDISYLALEASAGLGIPGVGLCSLSWDKVVEPYVDRAQSAHLHIMDDIVQAYGKADSMIRPMPGLPMSAFRDVRDVGPIADPLPSEAARVRHLAGALDNQRVVLIGFGGIALTSLPFDRLATMSEYRFIVSGPVPGNCKDVVSDSSIPLPFRTLLASVDVLMTKPGYSTITEAVAAKIPLVYVRRYNFADEATLVDYAHRYGRAVELSAHDFATGRWESVLKAAQDCPAPRDPAPSPTGASEAADSLMAYLE